MSDGIADIPIQLEQTRKSMADSLSSSDHVAELKHKIDDLQAIRQDFEGLPNLVERSIDKALDVMNAEPTASAEDLKSTVQTLSAKLEEIKKEISVTQTSVSRTIQAHMDGTRDEVSRQLRRVTDSMLEASKNFSSNTRLQEQELQTILSLQEHLVSNGIRPGAGPKDLPDFRKLALALENGEAKLNTEQPSVEFMGHSLNFDDLFSVYVVYKEIFLYEDYYAELGAEAPRIIDGGAHIGMAALYFKNRYPAAKILCFEPDPRNFELLTKNTAHLGEDIEKYNLALTDDGADYPLMRRQGQSMASSIYSRYTKINNEDGLVIKSAKLSDFLDAPVDLLKLDIEGAEDGVLQECKHLLKNVHYLFIEFHTGDQLPLSRLRAILETLDDAGFTYQIERAREYQIRMLHRPFTHLDQLCTHVIHAKNLTW
ncbi:FkbM family methyltransferase [Phaeobacter sp. 11ANDIMAR09]|uniref:FkbM family methyltransferase n=1 Tax=Phaeobacter sp. 11ANDIMAR09 TaxID=1225647 RepID=UPI0006D6B7B3|nr:FkbM family methyltransferase [Phaeobacter sp. 11ANDIMAR09]KPD11543.1 hypothetical protein AN476_14960 [Phaeobacter sp. 11ANDIMAR09]